MVRRFSTGGGTSGIELALLSPPSDRGTDGGATQRQRNCPCLARETRRGFRATRQRLHSGIPRDHRDRLTFVNLALNSHYPHQQPVEDWEQFFVAKSRRRFDRERLDQRRRTGAVIGAAIVILVIVVGIISFAAEVSAR